MNDITRASKEHVFDLPSELRRFAKGCESGYWTGVFIEAAQVIDAARKAVHEPCVRPSAWYRGVRCAGSPSEPAEYDVEMSYGDDQPEGKGWLPLYRLPEGPTGDYRDQLYGLLVRHGWSHTRHRPPHTVAGCLCQPNRRLSATAASSTQ